MRQRIVVWKMTDTRALLTIPNTSDRAVYVVFGDYYPPSTPLYGDPQAPGTSGTFGVNMDGTASYVGMYVTATGSWPRTPDQYISYPLTVYVNGNPILNIPVLPPSIGASSNLPVRIMMRLVVQQALNYIVITPTHLSDPTRIEIVVAVIPGTPSGSLGLNTSFTFGAESDINSVIFYGTRAVMTSIPGNTQPSQYLDSTEPGLIGIAVFPSYVATDAGKPIHYVDGYGRTLTNTPGQAMVTYQSGGLADTIFVPTGTPVFYDRLQGYWRGVEDPHLSWDINGYITSGVVGSYTIYPLTSRGCISLTVIVIDSQPSTQPTEISFFGFSGCIINVSSFPGIPANSTVSAPGVSIVNGTITLPSSSVKYHVGSYVLALNVLPSPTVRQISAAVGIHYSLRELMRLDGNIPDIAYTARDPTTNTTSTASITWATQVPNAGRAAVYVYNIKVADVILKNVDTSCSTIFAPQGKNVNLFNFFKSTAPSDRLLEVYNDEADGIVAAPDGTLRFGNFSVTELRCKLVLSGVELVYDSQNPSAQSSLAVTVVSDSARTYYVEPGAAYRVTIPNGDEIHLITSTGQIPLTGAIATREITVTTSAVSGGIHYSIVPRLECLLIYGTPGSSNGTEVHLIPFESPRDTRVPITCVKDKLGNVTISMPRGPTYQISLTTTFPTYPAAPVTPFVTEFGGGSTTFQVATGVTKLYMLPANLIVMSGQTFYTLDLVEGKKRVFGLVNRRRISNASATDVAGGSSLPSNLPNFIKPDTSGPNLIVTRVPGDDMSEIFVAKLTGSTTTYVQYVFKILPPIKLKQTLFYTPNMIFTDILPMGDYEYDPSLDPAALIKPVSGSTTVTVNFSYGEFRTQYGNGGLFTLVLYDKKIVTKRIYLATVVTGTTIHTTAGDEIDMSSGSYENNGVTFTRLPTSSIRAELSQAGLDVGQYFFVDSNGGSTLYSFQNVQAPSHPDIYIFSETTGNATWTVDADIRIGTQYYPTGTTVSLAPGQEVTAVIQYDQTSPYYLSDTTFNIVDVEGNPMRYNFCRGIQLPLFSDPIVAFMTEPPNKQSYGGSAAFKTQFFDVRMTGNAVGIQTIAPLSGAMSPVRKETIYIVTQSVGGQTKTNIIELNAYPVPFNAVENFQYYNGDVPTHPTFGGQGLITVTGLQYVANPTAVPVTETNLSVGQNNVSYSFTPPTGLAEAGFSSVFNIKVIPKPASINLDRLVKVGELLEDDLLLNQFGGSTDYTVTNISIDTVSVITGIPATSATGTQGGLTVTLDSTQRMTFSATQAAATTPGSSSPLPNGHQVVITFDYYPDGAAYKTTVTITLSVFVWDPTRVRQVLARATTDASGTRRARDNSTPITPPTSASSTLMSFNRDGRTLTGTSDDVLDWSEYSTSTRAIYLFSTTSVVRNYFIFTSEEVVLFTVVILPPSIAPKTVQFPTILSGSDDVPVSQVTINILALFFPDLETSMLNAGATLGLVNNSPAPGNSTLTSYIAAWVPNSVATSVQILMPESTSPITTVSYICAAIARPTLVVQNPEFVIPIRQAFTVTSEMVSLNSQLTSSDSSVRNFSGGITVSFQVAGTHTVVCTLTNQGVTSISVTITFLAYDPTRTIDDQQTNWTGTFLTNFVGQAAAQGIVLNPSAKIVSYSINGTNYGITTSQFVTAVSMMQLTIQLTVANPTVVIVVKLTDGNIAIFKGVYNVVNGGTQKNFLLEGALNGTIFTYDQLSDVPVNTANASLVYTPPPNALPLGSQGYKVFGPDLSLVAYILPTGASVLLTPVAPGVLDLTGLAVRIGTSTFPITPYVETLAKIVTQTQPVLAEKGTLLNYNLNNFIVSGVGQVIFTGWQISSDGGTTYTSVLPSWLVISMGVLKTTLLTAAGSFLLRGTVQSTKFPALTSPVAFSLVITDPLNASDLSLVLVSNLESTLLLSSPAVSVNGIPVTGSSELVNGIKIVFGPASGTQLLTFSSATGLQGPVTITIVTMDSHTNFVTVTRVPSEQNLNIVAFGYTGRLFKKTSGSTVVSYTASGSSVPSTQLNMVFQPNTQQTIGTASVLINTDGSFQISNAQSLTLTVMYVLGNSTASPQTLTVSVGAGAHPVKTIEQSPPPTISLGTNVSRVLIAGNDLADGDSMNLGYATFTLGGSALQISDISSEFQPTLVQAENILTARINVVSMLIDINRDVTTQPVYRVPLSSTVQFVLPFEPSRVTYNTMTLNGANQVFKLYTELGKHFATTTVSGTALTITSTGVAAFSQPIGFLNKTGSYTYIIVQTVDTTSSTLLAIGSVVQSPPGLTFQTIGTLDGRNVTTPGQTLANTVAISLPVTVTGVLSNALQVLSISLTTSFSFYATLSDGSIRFYTIRFLQQTITVSDLTQIPVRAFTGGAVGPVTFTQPGVTVVGNFVRNPASLRVLTMISPFYGQFAINLLR